MRFPGFIISVSFQLLKLWILMWFVWQLVSPVFQSSPSDIHSDRWPWFYGAKCHTWAETKKNLDRHGFVRDMRIPEGYDGVTRSSMEVWWSERERQRIVFFRRDKRKGEEEDRYCDFSPF